jgi:hypothetical protein
MTIEQAANEYIKRQQRINHPDGKTDKAGRWYPADQERQSCCEYIRRPSCAWPWSLMVHCRTLRHVAHVCGVDERELRRAVRVAQCAESAGRIAWE